MSNETDSNLAGVGKLQERYRILAKLGSGGMADVFLGVQLGEESFQRLVVIKRIHSLWLENQNAMQMFIAEARTVASLSHPHIVKIYDLSRLGRDVCIAMEYVTGENLDYTRRVVRKANKRIPLAITCKLMVEACEALYYAHTARAPDGTPLELVHRDIGPHNLMLDNNGYLKVIDFGIAKSSARSDMTTPGIIKGKFSYLPPDLFKHERIDGRADLYALGLVFYELVTLRRSFRFKQDVAVAEVIKRVCKEPLPRPSRVVPELPKQLDPIILKATHKERDQRYQSCEALANDIRRFAETVGGLATAAQVEAWYKDTLAARIEKRREFEMRALEKAKSTLHRELESSIPALHTTGQFSQSNLVPITGVSQFQRQSQTSSVKTERRRANPYILLVMFFVLFTGGAVLVHQLFFSKRVPLPPPPRAKSVAPPADNLLVISEPSHAEVWIDGKKVGNTSRSGLALRVATSREHTLEVLKDGFEPYRLGVVGERSGQRRITARLAPPPVATDQGTKLGAATAPAVSRPDDRSEVGRSSASRHKGKRHKKPSTKRTGKSEGSVASASPAQDAATQPTKPSRPADRTATKAAATADAPFARALPPSAKPEVKPKPDAIEPMPRTPTKPVPKTEPVSRPEPPEATNVAVAPTVRWYSGDGQWPGAQVAKRGCSRCHSGSKAPLLEWSQKSRRQWQRFFRRKRHDRHLKLDRHFSEGELNRLLAFILDQIERKQKKGIAGVK